MVMQGDSLRQWLAAPLLFRRSAFRDLAQAPGTGLAALIVAAGGLLVNGAGALAAGLPAELVIAGALAGIAAALLAWVCLAALAALLVSRGLRAPLALRPALCVAGFAGLWRWLGMMPALTLAGDALATVALGVALAALAPGRPGRVALIAAACAVAGALVHAIAGRLIYALLSALWTWLGLIQP